MNEMKLSIKFKNLDPDEIKRLWLKLNELKNKLEYRIGESFIVGIDPVSEKFYLMPASEAFSFYFPVSYSLQDVELINK